MYKKLGWVSLVCFFTVAVQAQTEDSVALLFKDVQQEVIAKRLLMAGVTLKTVLILKS